MTFTDFSKRGLEIAQKFRGRPKEFFAALKLEFSDSNLPEMLEREHKRSKGTASSETLKPIFDALKPTASVAHRVGESVLGLALHFDKRVSAPLQKGLEKSLAAHARITAEQFAAENAAPQMLFSEFTKLSQRDRAAFIRGGGTLVDEAPTAVPPIAPGAKSITMAQLKTLPHADRAKFFREGGKLTE